MGRSDCQVFIEFNLNLIINIFIFLSPHHHALCTSDTPCSSPSYLLLFHPSSSSLVWLQPISGLLPEQYLQWHNNAHFLSCALLCTPYTFLHSILHPTPPLSVVLSGRVLH